MSKILGSTLRKADASTPILARSRGVERKLEEEKMEAKARKVISSEKKRLANKDRVKPDYTGMEYEKKLRKVATRGGRWSFTGGLIFLRCRFLLTSGRYMEDSPQKHIFIRTY